MKNGLHRATNVFINLSLTNLHFSRDLASDSGIFYFINLQKAGPVKSKEKKKTGVNYEKIHQRLVTYVATSQNNCN